MNEVANASSVQWISSLRTKFALAISKLDRKGNLALVGILFIVPILGTACSEGGRPTTRASQPTPSLRSTQLQATSAPKTLAAPTTSPVPTQQATEIPVAEEGEVQLSVSLEYPESELSYLDLDSGKRTPSGGDIKYSVSRGTMTFYYFEPVNDAMALLMGPNAPDYQGCESKLSEFKTTNIPDANVGDYICILTNSGSIAQLMVQRVAPHGEGTIEVRYAIWE
jgi:hypothetical protein